jgi:hypothetical protein
MSPAGYQSRKQITNIVGLLPEEEASAAHKNRDVMANAETLKQHTFCIFLFRPDGGYGDRTWWKYVMGKPSRYWRWRLGTPMKTSADIAATSSKNRGVISVFVQTHVEGLASRRREAQGRSMGE